MSFEVALVVRMILHRVVRSLLTLLMSSAHVANNGVLSGSISLYSGIVVKGSAYRMNSIGEVTPPCRSPLVTCMVDPVLQIFSWGDLVIYFMSLRVFCWLWEGSSCSTLFSKVASRCWRFTLLYPPLMSIARMKLGKFLSIFFSISIWIRSNWSSVDMPGLNPLLF